MRHVIWDWNGTLFDDLHIVVEAVNRGLAGMGFDPITFDQYREHYTRPVKVFYERILRRRLDDGTWHRLDDLFHDAYRELLEHAELNVEADRAMRRVAATGASQSLLSMFPHRELVPLVAKLGVDRHLLRVDGLRGTPGDRKQEYLERHLRALIEAFPGRVGPEDVLVIGDTPDDAAAARHVGTVCVLYDGGSHHRSTLEGLGVPVAATLLQALDLGGIGS